MDPKPAIRYYGRRKGKRLKAGRQTVFETLLPQIQITLPEDSRAVDPRTFFTVKPQSVSLEVGFGGGEHLASLAASAPDKGFIGCEVFLNGVASMVRHVSELGLSNVRIFDNDAHHLLPRLTDASLDRIFLMFPDPWPKSRHAKRRFINRKMLDELARLLVDGGEFRVATDHPVYMRWTLLHGTENTQFEWAPAGSKCWRERPPDSPRTRYEEKARKEGRSPIFLSFKRRPRCA